MTSHLPAVTIATNPDLCDLSSSDRGHLCSPQRGLRPICRALPYPQDSPPVPTLDAAQHRALILRACSGCAWMTSGSGDQPMQPKSQHWIWMTLAVLALTIISYFVVPPAVIKQTTVLLSWG